ncbi:MAG TPA: L-histidine N(alpha)-methyltransferase [Rhodanobacteraceae bacterium]|jgi:dimethylhistidine N-methyltransferase|nr:L-histidine N(alpha)-methyltransferase [Rhodanobacteraceae bacterium]
MTGNPRAARIHQVDDRRPGNELLGDVLAGLARTPKQLPSKYFYDARGSRLFERICEQPEYYPTRTELAIMRAHIDGIAAALGPGVRLVEYGSGCGLKTQMLLGRLEAPVAYVPVEISRSALAASVAGLERRFPAIEMLPVCADFTQPIKLPRAARAPRQTVVYFPGSTLGNFDPDDALRLLRQMRAEAGQGGGVLPGGVLIGVDLVKDTAALEAAYNDAAGVTAEFTLNLLTRVNRELGADFDLGTFRHRARWRPLAGRIETHIVSQREQIVHVAGRGFRFAAGEAMLVEYSCKYTLEGFARLAARAGFKVAGVWTDPARRFSVQWLACN